MAKKSSKAKHSVDFRIPELPVDLHKEILFHKNHRMTNDPTMPEAAINLLCMGIEFLKNQTK